jgi:Ni,Fe-hydrogenase maturation factor
MDAVEKDLIARYDEIKAEIKAIFNANFKITGWDVPEVDEKEVKIKLLELMQKAFDEVKQEVLEGK